MRSNDEKQLPDYLQISIGTVIRAWRIERRLTLEELAKRAGGGITRGYLSQLENNKIHTPGEGKLALVANALDIAPLDLVTRTFPNTEARHTLPEQMAAGPGMDLSRLITALSRVPAARRQQYVDALIALVEHLTAGESERTG